MKGNERLRLKRETERRRVKKDIQRERGRERESKREGESSTLPCGSALPHVADAAFKSLGGVSEGAHAAVPVAVVCVLFGLSFWPFENDTKRLRFS